MFGDRRSKTRSLSLFLAVVLLLSVFGGIATGQATPGPTPAPNATNTTNTTTTAATPATTPSTTNTTSDPSATQPDANATNDSEVSLDAAADTGSSASATEPNRTNSTSGTTTTTGGGVLDPWGKLQNMLRGVSESARNGIASFIDSFNNIFAGFPAPGSLDTFETSMVTPMSPLYPGEWTPPTNGLWGGVAKTYILLSWVVIPTLFLFLTGTFAKTPAEQRDMAPRALAAIALVFFGFPLLSLLFHTVDSVILTIVPGGSEFLASPEGVGKFGLGVLFGVGLIYIDVGLVGIAVLVLLMFYLAAHVVVAIWPLAMLAWAAPVTIVNYVAYAEFGAILMLVTIRIIQGVITRFVFSIDVGPIAAGPASSAAGIVVTTVLTIVGLWIAFVTVPKLGLQKIIPALQMPIGNRAQKRASEVSENARERVPSADELHEKVFTARGGESADSGAAPRKQSVGSVTDTRSYGATAGSPNGDGTTGTTAGEDSGTTPENGGVDAEKQQKRIDRKQREIDKGFQ